VPLEVEVGSVGWANQVMIEPHDARSPERENNGGGDYGQKNGQYDGV